MGCICYPLPSQEVQCFPGIGQPDQADPEAAGSGPKQGRQVSHPASPHGQHVAQSERSQGDHPLSNEKGEKEFV